MKNIYIVVYRSPYGPEADENKIAFLTREEAENYIRNKWNNETKEDKMYYTRNGYIYDIDEIKLCVNNKEK